MMQDDRRLLITVKEAARLLGVSARMLYAHLQRGRVPDRIVVRLGRRTYLVRAGLEGWLLGRLTDEAAPETETRR
ncbi:MAG: helix-turn-helix domain-containing protein [Armatimonadota bacterium]|nr:helix-turn-helix domain-containing protein [Armatimonadota bacterium]MDR7444587.1 helix-turn-helix domain-containing protein [Armatimonadota bacterium]MDR7570247.1 helix-turn-helix domain-containing protein [Armatimonadota bacterium]MDR7615557.1 helix-turn-helix domain-containing protein [Armatimonadota bacterium]